MKSRRAKISPPVYSSHRQPASESLVQQAAVLVAGELTLRRPAVAHRKVVVAVRAGERTAARHSMVPLSGRPAANIFRCIACENLSVVDGFH